jgi:hypothetical protein
MAGVLALACLAVPASARSPFDGDWSVVIVTQQGACDAAYRYGVAINNGMVGARDSSGGTVQGRVAPNGAVSVSVRSGSQSAGGSGRLGRDSGGGVWRGQGSRGACSGTWQATRQSAGPYAGGTTGAAPAQRYEGSGVASCARFRSYDPATGTYLGRDGTRHRC